MSRGFVHDKITMLMSDPKAICALVSQGSSVSFNPAVHAIIDMSSGRNSSVGMNHISVKHLKLRQFPSFTTQVVDSTLLELRGLSMILERLMGKYHSMHSAPNTKPDIMRYILSWLGLGRRRKDSKLWEKKSIIGLLSNTIFLIFIIIA